MDRFEEKLKQANATLVLVKLRTKGDRIYFRATLPPKPGEFLAQRRELSIGCVANLAGLKIAIAKAQEIEAQLQLGKFDWNPWLKPSERAPETCKDWIDRFKQDFFERKGETPYTVEYYSVTYESAFKRLPPMAPISVEILRQTVLAESDPDKPDSALRKRLTVAFITLARFVGLDTKPLAAVGGNYKGRKPEDLKIPADSEILEVLAKIQNPRWRCAIGLMAAYGLRPHEAFRLDTSRIAEPEAPIIVLQNTKTGTRKVFPYPAEWVDLLELRNVELPKINTEITNRLLGGRVQTFFRRHGIPFNPYALRHAYAVRLAVAGINPAVAAKLLGHSLEQYCRTYLRHMDESHLLKALGR